MTHWHQLPGSTGPSATRMPTASGRPELIPSPPQFSAMSVPVPRAPVTAATDVSRTEFAGAFRATAPEQCVAAPFVHRPVGDPPPPALAPTDAKSPQISSLSNTGLDRRTIGFGPFLTAPWSLDATNGGVVSHNSAPFRVHFDPGLASRRTVSDYWGANDSLAVRRLPPVTQPRPSSFGRGVGLPSAYSGLPALARGAPVIAPSLFAESTSVRHNTAVARFPADTRGPVRRLPTVIPVAPPSGMGTIR